MNRIPTFRASSALASTIWLATALSGCGGDSGDVPEGGDSGDPPAGAGAVSEAEGEGYRSIEVTGGGTIRGVVRFAGTVPSPQRIASADDAETCGEFQEVRLIETGAGGGLANAVLSLTDIREGAALELPVSAPELDQNGCHFSPHVQVVPLGSPVAILNPDPIMHNVHTFTFDNRPMNRSQPPGVERIELEFTVPEKVRVRCDVHDWMSAWLIVAEHPYHVVTGADGSFEIGNVPPGTYSLESWHESLGATTQSVTVEAGGTVEIAIVMTEGEG